MDIPIGCPHAVMNHETSIKVAVDYLPVKSLPYALHMQAYRRVVALEERASNEYRDVFCLHFLDKLRAVEYVLAASEWVATKMNL